ncbi:3-hydroxyacyl-CoA dehydrogenase NAD-binding domain-containing protein [Metabacillus idriensis]
MIRSTASIASNTSAFPITKLAEACTFSERLLITHFFKSCPFKKIG